MTQRLLTNYFAALPASSPSEAGAQSTAQGPSLGSGTLFHQATDQEVIRGSWRSVGSCKPSQGTLLPSYLPQAPFIA